MIPDWETNAKSIFRCSNLRLFSLSTDSEILNRLNEKIEIKMSAEEDTELRDLVAQTLEANGVLGKIRVRLTWP
jgi:hypothetical protein